MRLIHDARDYPDWPNAIWLSEGGRYYELVWSGQPNWPPERSGAVWLYANDRLSTVLSITGALNDTRPTLPSEPGREVGEATYAGFLAMLGEPEAVFALEVL